MQLTPAIEQFVQRREAFGERNVNSVGKVNFRCLRSDCFWGSQTHGGHTIVERGRQDCKGNQRKHLTRSTFGSPYQRERRRSGLPFAIGSAAIRGSGFQVSFDSVIRWSSMTFNRAALLDVFGLALDESGFSLRQPATVVDMWNALESDSDGLTMDGRIAEAYNEEAFKYFLHIERRRAELTGRSFLLLLIDLKNGSDAHAESNGTAGRVFSALVSCLRDTDFIGWYEEGRVAGGVLTQDAVGTTTNSVDSVMERVCAALAARVPDGTIGHEQVCVYQIPVSQNGRV